MNILKAAAQGTEQYHMKILFGRLAPRKLEQFIFAVGLRADRIPRRQTIYCLVRLQRQVKVTRGAIFSVRANVLQLSRLPRKSRISEYWSIFMNIQYHSEYSILFYILRKEKTGKRTIRHEITVIYQGSSSTYTSIG